MKKAEQLVCGPVAQLFSFVGINVAHHKGHVILNQIVKTCSLLQHAADHFMCNLNAALLVGALRIAVEDSGSALSVSSKLDG